MMRKEGTARSVVSVETSNSTETSMSQSKSFIRFCDRKKRKELKYFATEGDGHIALLREQPPQPDFIVARPAGTIEGRNVIGD